MNLAELSREALRLESAAYSLRRALAEHLGTDAPAWRAAAEATGALERCADALRELEKAERHEGLEEL